MKEFYQFRESLANRGITDLTQIAIELLRIHLTREVCQENIDPAQRYARMQQETGSKLGFFQGEPDWFEELYQLGIKVDLMEGVASLFKYDRSGMLAVEPPLADYLLEQIISPRFQTVLIAEAHKLLPDLTDWRKVILDKELIFTAEEKWQVELLRYLFRDDPLVKVIQLSIYWPLDLEQEFDYILAIPAFGQKVDIDSEYYFTKESEGVAVQNLVEYLSEQGEMSVLVPSRFTFSGGGFRRLREWMLKQAFLSRIVKVPLGLLKPHKGIQTYMLTFTPLRGTQIDVVELSLEENKRLTVKDEKQVAPQLLLDREDWRFEVLLKQFGVDQLERLVSGDYRVVKLSEIAELFRGKSIPKSKIKPGEVHVLNISDISEGEIVWEHLDTIDETPRKVKRYELEKGDVVITCRGTMIKVALVRELPYFTIASSNLIVIRIEDQDVDSEYVKIFLESPVGMELVRSFQRGSTVMNIHPDDLGELKLPLPSLKRQQNLVKKYRQEHQLFQEAKRRWEQMRQEIYDLLVE